MDAPNDHDDTPTVFSEPFYSPELAIDRLMRRNIQQYEVAASVVSLDWDNHDTLMSLSIPDIAEDDEVFEDAVEDSTIEDLLEANIDDMDSERTESDLERHDDTAESSHTDTSAVSLRVNTGTRAINRLWQHEDISSPESSEEDVNFSQLYVPSSDSSEDSPGGAQALQSDAVGTRTRSKSTCSDRSEETFNRGSRLRQARRPLQRSYEALDLVDSPGPQRNAASRQPLN